MREEIRNPRGMSFAKIATRFSLRQDEVHLLLACRTIQFLRD